MYRNVFAVFATLAFGVGAASAATTSPASQDQSLEQRILAAQQAIGSVLNADKPAAKADNDQVAQYYWRNYFRNYFPNHFRNYYGG